MLTILECQEGDKLHIFYSDRRFKGSEIFNEPELTALCNTASVEDCAHKIDTYTSVDEAKRVMIFMENYICKPCLETLDKLYVNNSNTKRS